MLRKSRRLTTKTLNEVLKNGRAVHSPLLLVRYARLSTDTPSAFAAVAPVKIAKTSVARHKIRRRLYAAVRPYMERLPSGWSVIAFAKQPAVSAEMADLRRSLEEVFVKAGLLR